MRPFFFFWRFEMIKITFNGVKITNYDGDSLESLIQTCIAATVGATYDADQFQNAMIDWLCDRNFVVMTQDEFNEMLDEHEEIDENNRINDLPKAKAAFSQEEYDAGFNDGYAGEIQQENASATYYEGFADGQDDAAYHPENEV
jgi:hypothetical protein